MTTHGIAGQPLDMVRRAGYDPKDWQFTGKQVGETQTRCFKWVSVGYQPNLDAVRAECAKHGRVPEGQWREAVNQMFQPDGQHPRGVADPSWVDPNTDARFPYVLSDGFSNFGWAGGDRDDGWLWLVEVSSSTKA